MTDAAMDTSDSRFTVLVLCTGNSARSIMAEALFNSIGKAAFVAYSAGSKPTGKVNPLALEQIAGLGKRSEDYRSKHWREFIAADAPRFDFIVSVCESAAEEVCPVFPGDIPHVCWKMPDPAAVTDDLDQGRAAFEKCFDELKARISTLSRMPLFDMGRCEVAAAMQSLACSTE